MYSSRVVFKNIISSLNNGVSISERYYSTKSIKIDKILVVSKLSRYEYERKKSKLDDKCLEKELRSRGTDFEKLIHYHNLHKKFEKNVLKTFTKMGIDVEVVNRFNYTDEKIKWADIVVPIGGDGTFLLAALRIRDNQKPVIGFNSDPSRSEGHLCLPKKYSTNISAAIKCLQQGKFEWLLRSRICTKLMCKNEEIQPTYLHEIDFKGEQNPIGRSQRIADNEQILPVLALNEVFVGEALSARVSHLQMKLNGSNEQTNIKCSGICICTGTGSTSWHLSINRLPVQSVAELLRIIDIDADSENDEFAERITNIYNKNLIFDPRRNEMGYTIRDLISAGVWPQPKGIKQRGFAKKIEIKSNCFDANLVIDGGVSYDFNDGTIAKLEIRPEDALRTVILQE